MKITSKRIICIRSETEDYLATDINEKIENMSNVLEIKIFDREGYWVAFIIYSIEHV